MVKALVSATAASAVVHAYADRVHDAARRLGCAEPAATEVTRTAVSTLIDDLDKRPDTVKDLVGGLFARSRAAARRVSHSPVSVAGESGAPAATLASLPAEQRFAVLLRDSYGLSLDQAAVALGLDEPEAARVIALARSAMTAAHDRAPVATLTGHDVAIGDLGQLSDSSAPAGGRFNALRRHVSQCARCAAVLSAQSRAQDLLTALPVLALRDVDRVSLLRDTEQRAAVVLPTEAEVRTQLQQGSRRQPLLPPVLVGGLTAVALVAGLGIGALAGSGATSSTSAAATVDTSSSIPATATSRTPVLITPSALIAPTTVPLTPAPVPSPATTPASSRTSATRSSGPPAGKATRLVAVPATGAYGTAVQLVGSGFTAGESLSLAYEDERGNASGTPVTVQADASGAFRARGTVSDGTSSTSNTGTHHFVARAASTGIVVARVAFNQTG